MKHPASSNSTLMMFKIRGNTTFTKKDLSVHYCSRQCINAFNLLDISQGIFPHGAKVFSACISLIFFLLLWTYPYVQTKPDGEKIFWSEFGIKYLWLKWLKIWFCNLNCSEPVTLSPLKVPNHETQKYKTRWKNIAYINKIKYMYLSTQHSDSTTICTKNHCLIYHITTNISPIVNFFV